MSTRLRHAGLLAAAVWLALPAPVQAARVLFVSDHDTDLAIADVLRADGHDVMAVESDFDAGANPTFHADLSSFDCIVWSATNDGAMTAHTDAAAFSNLLDFASNGGNVLVTGFGSVGHDDARLLAFLGAADGQAYSGAPQPIADLDTDLTTGVVDLRRITPSNFGRFGFEALLGLDADTIEIVGAGTVPLGSQWTIRSVGMGHIAWVAGIEGSDEEWSVTTSGPGGAFNGALRNFVAASTGTASVPGAPRIAISSRYAADEGVPLGIDVRVTDDEGDTVTFSWDLDGDGAYGEAPDTTHVDIPAGTTDGPSTFVIGVEASDGVHTSHHSRSIAIHNVTPTIASHPPSIAAIDQHVQYRLAIVDPGGAHDVPTFTLVTGPSTAVVTEDGVLDWMPTEAEITPAGTTRMVQIDVDDGDGGMATQSWSMVVIADHAPSEPTMLYPTTDAPVLAAGLHFVIGNASDLDGDTLTYEIELASDPDFATDARTSGELAGAATGITEWSPDESALHVGRWYWRASASDGQVQSQAPMVSFLIVPDPATFPDAARADGGPDSPPETPRGCGCGIAGSRADFATVLAIFAWIALSASRGLRRR